MLRFIPLRRDLRPEGAAAAEIRLTVTVFKVTEFQPRDGEIVLAALGVCLAGRDHGEYEAAMVVIEGREAVVRWMPRRRRVRSMKAVGAGGEGEREEKGHRRHSCFRDTSERYIGSFLCGTESASGTGMCVCVPRCLSVCVCR